MQDLTREKPYLRVLGEKAVSVVDDLYLGLKESFGGPDILEYRRSHEGARRRGGDRWPIHKGTGAAGGHRIVSSDNVGC